MVHLLAQMSWPQWFLGAVVIAVCILLMIVILLQRGRGGGLSGAFGGGGGSAAFGAKTGDVFTWITVAFTTVFVLLTVAANFAFDESARPLPEAPTAPVTENVTVPVGTAAPEGSDDSKVQLIDMGGEAVKTGEGSKAVPIKVTPVTVPADTAPNAAGTPVVPEKNEGAGTDDSKTDKPKSETDAADGSGG